MPLSTLSLKRSLLSYAKVQAFLGPLIRNRSFQLRRKRVIEASYLEVGCGQNYHSHFVHLDYLWHPGIDVCWDITRGLPFAAGTFKGVFSEHCLEHFSLPAALFNLREIYRVLAPGGTARIVVPDGGLYLQIYSDRLNPAAEINFPYEESDVFEDIRTPMLSVNRIFYVDRDSLFGHRTLYDFPLLAALMTKVGFVNVQKCKFGKGRDPQLLVDAAGRRIESLYVEGSVV